MKVPMFFRKMFERKIWRYVGTVEKRTEYTTHNGKDTGRVSIRVYTLFVDQFGRRELVHTGDTGGGSPYALAVEAQVQTWLRTGVVPKYMLDAAPIPEPEEDGPKGKLVVFDGGKR